MPAPKLKLGDIVEGHTYMGGEPNNKESWLNTDDLARTGLSGDELLGKLKETNPSMVPIIQSMSEGRYPVPTNRVATDPYWQTLFQVANQYDPSLDAVDYPTRQKTSASFRGDGLAARNIKNLNQGIGHLNDLVDAIPKVAGHSGFLGLGTLINSAQNAYESGSGDPGITSYEIPRTALAGELASIFKGTGTSAEKEVDKWYEALGMNKSTAQKQEAARQLTGLLKSRLDALAEEYKTGMGKARDGISFLNPTAQKQFIRAQSLGLTPEKAAAVATAQDDASVIKPDTSGMDPATAALFKKYNIPMGGR